MLRRVATCVFMACLGGCALGALGNFFAISAEPGAINVARYVFFGASSMFVYYGLDRGRSVETGEPSVPALIFTMVFVAVASLFFENLVG